MNLLANEWRRYVAWCTGSLDARLPTLISVNLPRFPRLSVILIFLVCPSFYFGNTVPWIVLGLVVLFDVRWWFSHLRYSVLLYHPLRVLFFLLLVCFVASATLSLDPLLSWRVLGFSLLILWFFLGAYVLLTHMDMSFWLPWLIGVLYCVALLMIYQIVLWTPLLGGFSPGKIRLYCWFMVCISPVIIFWCRQDTRNRWALLLFVVVFVSACILENRATVIGLNTIILVLIWHYRAALNFWTIPLLLLSTALSVFLVSYGFQGKHQIYVDMPGAIFAPSWLIDPLRQLMWAFVWDVMPSTPPFGFGVRASFLIPGADQPVPWLLPNYVKIMGSKPHNTFLQWYLEIGWVGFSLMMAIFGSRLLFLLRKKDNVYVTEWMLHGAYFGISFFNTDFWGIRWLMTYLFSLVIMTALSSHSHRQTNQGSQSPNERSRSDPLMQASQISQMTETFDQPDL